MTQKELGEVLDLGEKGANRIAQYETLFLIYQLLKIASDFTKARGIYSRQIFPEIPFFIFKNLQIQFRMFFGKFACSIQKLLVCTMELLPQKLISTVFQHRKWTFTLDIVSANTIPDSRPAQYLLHLFQIFFIRHLQIAQSILFSDLLILHLTVIMIR